MTTPVLIHHQFVKILFLLQTMYNLYKQEVMVLLRLGSSKQNITSLLPSAKELQQMRVAGILIATAQTTRSLITQTRQAQIVRTQRQISIHLRMVSTIHEHPFRPLVELQNFRFEHLHHRH